MTRPRFPIKDARAQRSSCSRGTRSTCNKLAGRASPTYLKRLRGEINRAATSATTQAGHSAEKRESQPLVIEDRQVSLLIAEATAPRKRQGWPAVRETDKVADRQCNHAVQAPCLSRGIRSQVQTTARIPERRCARIHPRMLILAARDSSKTVRPRSNAEAARLASHTT